MNEKMQGWFNGLIGVVIFAGTLPATKIAIEDFSPQFLTIARATIAGIIALILLLLSRQTFPDKKYWYSIALVCLGTVICFPLFTSLALQYINSASSIVFVGILPLITAIFAVFLAKERPQKLFWLFATLGSLIIVQYIYFSMHTGFNFGSLFMLLAIIFCGMGYAEGAKLSRILGGWQVVCWALVCALPMMLVLSYIYFPAHIEQVNIRAYVALGYISLFSMLIGFFFWYKGLAIGGIASVGQIQLFQPLIGLLLAAWLLHEPISNLMIITAIGVMGTVLCAKRFA